MANLLRVERAIKDFGGLRAVADVSLELRPNEIVGLIGPNGAGKTTLINCISGVLKLTSGQVWLNDHNITRWRPHKICQAGIARTFQIPRSFPRLTVWENILVSSRAGEDHARAKLEQVGLAAKADLRASSLTFHERRKLEIARALAAQPLFLLLDEVMAGLNPTETVEMVNLLCQIRSSLQIGILWVEHVMGAVMECADRIIVLHQGTKLVEGLPAEIANDPQVIEVYLGERYEFREERRAQG
ncbi:MAG: ABC transporter ATP-binding protein [Anaerolineae bacterium]